MRRIWLALTVAALLCPVSLRGQAGSCDLVSSQTLDQRTQGGFQTIHIVAPVVQCTGGARITANEGTLFQASREIHMDGSVSFQDAERRLTSDRAIYSSVTGRLFATGNVIFTDLAEGMTLRGPELEYYRVMPARPQAQAIATRRPRLTLQPRQREGASQPADGEPVEIDGDRMTMTGDDQYTAVGRVEIRRSDFTAFSTEARVDQTNDRMELLGSARIIGEQFELNGETIDMLLPNDALERVHARRDAVLVGEDLRVDAPDLQLFFAEDLLQQMVARGGADLGPRPIASARAFRLEADSIDALIPSQRLDQVIAIGGARGESIDTVGLPPGRLSAPAAAGELTAADRDWILGDTVIGYFVPVLQPEPPDTADVEPVVAAAAPDTVQGPAAERGREEVELDRVVARGAARSLYRVQNERPENPPGLNYLVGETIELSFRGGELSVAEVRGLQQGLYLDPTPPAAQPETPGETPPAAPPAAEQASDNPRDR